jgi:predicted SnoaL-like aldol condensation-catalyzing enzyme
VIDELSAPDFIEPEELPPGIPPGRETPKVMFTMLRSAFPDFKATIEQFVAEGDTVVVSMTWTGTQKGEFMGIPPTGKSVSSGVIDSVRIAGGKFVEHWGIMDSTALMQYLAQCPRPTQLAARANNPPSRTRMALMPASG